MAIVKSKNKDPFADGESAIEALRRSMDGTKTTREGMYLLQIINQYICDEKEIFKRIPPKNLGGLPEGGRRNVQASALLRTEGRTDAKKQDGILPSGYTREQEIIGNWAERDGCWSDTPENDQVKKGRKHRTDLDGTEARIYYDGSSRIYKTVDASHYISYEHFLDRIAIHNAIFPETAMRVEGFGVRDDSEDNTGFVCVISQHFIKGKNVPGPEFVHENMKARGFDLPKFASGWFFVSDDGDLLITDVIENNCVISPKGQLMVFDCEAHLNTMETFQGTHVIPTLQYNEESVQEIRRRIKEVLPDEITLSELKKSTEKLDIYTQRRISGELDEKGRVTGTVPLDFNGVKQQYVIQKDPTDDNKVLVSTPANIKKMLQMGKIFLDNGVRFKDERKDINWLSYGENVNQTNIQVYFDLDKGRLVCRKVKRKNLRKETAKTQTL